MSQKKRLTFECHNPDCRNNGSSRIYSLFLEVEGLPKFLITCPFCRVEAEVDLALFRSTTQQMLRGKQTSAAPVEIYDFPSRIKTQPRS